VDVQPDTVKTIGDVDFEEVDWAKTRITAHDLTDQAFEGAPELHGFMRGQGDGVCVDARKTVVHNGTRTAFVLWHDAHWGHSKVGKVAEGAIWEYNPGCSVHHFCQFLT
jgi:hypothetical protein